MAVSSMGDVMTNSELRADIHSIATIPDADRDSTGPQQMWIWAGANIAPVNWALGALGIIAFFAGLSAGWSVEDGLVGALQGPISLNLLGGRGSELAGRNRGLRRAESCAWQARDVAIRRCERRKLMTEVTE